MKMIKTSDNTWFQTCNLKRFKDKQVLTKIILHATNKFLFKLSLTHLLFSYVNLLYNNQNVKKFPQAKYQHM